MALTQISPPKSLKEMAFDSIYSAILNGELQHGVLYSEPGLAQKLGISRTPIREALLELAGKGFVEFLPRKGFLLSQISPDRLEAMCSFRILLETGNMRYLAPHIKPEHIDHAEEILARGQSCLGDKDKQIQIDRSFHFHFCELTRNDYIIQAMRDIRNLIDWAAARLLSEYDRRTKSHSEHKKILDALRCGDSESAVSLLEDHLEISKKLALESLSRDNTSKELFPA